MQRNDNPHEIASDSSVKKQKSEAKKPLLLETAITQPLLNNYAFFTPQELCNLSATNKILDDRIKANVWERKLKDDFGCSPQFRKKIASVSSSNCKEVHTRIQYLKTNFYSHYQELQNINFDYFPLYMEIFPNNIGPNLRTIYLIRAATYGNYKLIKNELSKPGASLSAHLAAIIYSRLNESSGRHYIDAFVSFALEFNLKLIINPIASAVSGFMSPTPKELNIDGNTVTFSVRNKTKLNKSHAFILTLCRLIEAGDPKKVEDALKSTPVDLTTDQIFNETAEMVLSKGKEAIYDVFLKFPAIATYITSDSSRNLHRLPQAVASGSKNLVQKVITTLKEGKSPILNLPILHFLNLLAAASTGNKAYYEHYHEQVKRFFVLSRDNIDPQNSPIASFVAAAISNFATIALTRRHYSLLKTAMDDIANCIGNKESVEFKQFSNALLVAIKDAITGLLIYQKLRQIAELLEYVQRDFGLFLPENNLLLRDGSETSRILKLNIDSRLHIHNNHPNFSDLDEHQYASLISWYFFEATQLSSLPIKVQEQDVHCIHEKLRSASVSFTYYMFPFIYGLLTKQNLFNNINCVNLAMLNEIFIYAGRSHSERGLVIIKIILGDRRFILQEIMPMLTEIVKGDINGTSPHFNYFQSLINSRPKSHSNLQLALKNLPEKYLAIFLSSIEREELKKLFLKEDLLYLVCNTGSLKKIQLAAPFFPDPALFLLNFALTSIHPELFEWVIAEYKLTPTTDHIKRIICCRKLINKHAIPVENKLKIINLILKKMLAAGIPFTGAHLNQILNEIILSSNQNLALHVKEIIEEMTLGFPKEQRITIDGNTVTLLRNFTIIAFEFAHSLLKNPAALKKKGREKCH